MFCDVERKCICIPMAARSIVCFNSYFIVTLCVLLPIVIRSLNQIVLHICAAVATLVDNIVAGAILASEDKNHMMGIL